MPDALIARVGAQPPDRQPIHSLVVGDEIHPLPWPAVVVLILHPDGPMAYRYAQDGANGGDTWHESKEAALRSLDREYGSLLTEWGPVPRDEEPHAYAIRVAGRD
jgi:hypothetical protein